MLGPIALFPDPLIAQVLPASTFPDQVAEADRYLRTGGDVLQVEYQPWEPSVKAITRYPEVVRMMGGNLPWTSDVGLAFMNQEGDVMESIQRLRAQARAVGNLQTTPQQVVIVEERVIQIVPANPQIIYVPVYRPEIVFVTPPPRVGLHLAFGPPLPIGPWMNHDLNWRNREVIVWHQDHPRPHDWWYEPPSRHEHTTVVNNTTIVNNYTVYQPREHRPTVAPKAPAHPVREREGQDRDLQARQISGQPTNHPALPPPPATKPVPQRPVRLPPTNHVATTANPHAPATGATPPTTAPHDARVNGNAGNRRPGLTEATPQPYHPPQGRSSNGIPLSIETHRDPLPATITSPHERGNVNAPHAKPATNAHPGNAGNSGNKIAPTGEHEGKPQKKVNAEAKGRSKKSNENQPDADSRKSSDREDQPK